MAIEQAARRPEMFPTLTDAQIERLRPSGHERAFHAGEMLTNQGCYLPLTAVYRRVARIVFEDEATR